MEIQEAIDLFYSLRKLSDILELSENDIVAKITMFDKENKMKQEEKFQIEVYDEYGGNQFVFSSNHYPTRKEIKEELNKQHLLNTPPHHWESKYGGFTHEEGHWNFDKCSICGTETERYFQNNESETLKIDVEEKVQSHCNLTHTISILKDSKAIFAYKI